MITWKPGRRNARSRWIHGIAEVAAVAAFYLTYSVVRNAFGSAAVDPGVALRNAQWLIEAERSVGLFFEPALQRLVIDNTTLIWLSNVFYGSFHFVVTAVVLAWLFIRHPSDYRRGRNSLAVTTGLAILGFSLFPVMPPRLLGDCGPLGGCSSPRLVDTIAEVGGLWSFDSGVVASMSNQYAAVPSLHIAWALWCALVVHPRVRSSVLRAMAVLYPIVTLVTTMITANHFWLDAAVGALVVAAGCVIAAKVERIYPQRSLEMGVGDLTDGENRQAAPAHRSSNLPPVELGSP